MTVLEFFKIHRLVFKQYIRLKLNLSDFNYIGMIEEYNRMLKEGRKEANVRALMCRRYKITNSKFKGLERRLNRVYNVDDVID